MLPVQGIEETPVTDIALIDKIVGFINEIGIECKEVPLPEKTFMPGLTIRDGSIIYDRTRLTYPGDLIHEAGHLAVLLPSHRRAANIDQLPCDVSAPAAELAAITWSWAAVCYLQIPPDVLFHPGGYKGASQSFIDNFSNGRYLAVAMLRWMGMTNEVKHGVPPDEHTYPKLKHWLRQDP